MVALAKQGILAFRVRTKNTRGPIRESRRWVDFPGYERCSRRLRSIAWLSVFS